SHGVKMDLIKAFSSGSEQYQITVKGDHKKPLFKAADIARILEISNVSESLKDYDEDEKTTLSLTEGSRKVANFLTEIGLYRFILSTQKNKPFVKRFKKWVCQVISEIRATGEYRLTKQIETTEAKLIEFQQEKTAIEARAEEDRKRAEEAEVARKEAEGKAAEEQKRREELELKFQKRTHEPIEKTGHVYVMETDGGVKVGKTREMSRVASRGCKPATGTASRSSWTLKQATPTSWSEQCTTFSTATVPTPIGSSLTATQTISSA
ncbi:hypothetical protein HK102_002232, partial [Quaeritorhiza haematococci]